MVKIKIIRHSARLDFTRPFYWLICFGHYWADSPLTDDGYQMANIKGKQMVETNFNPKYIYTSPYLRTMATATEIQKSFPHATINPQPLLSEYQPTFKHKINLFPEGIPTTFDGDETVFSYPENKEQFTNRVKYIISKLMDKNNDCIIVTHGEILKIYIDYLQEQFPNLLLDAGTVPYLTIISFEFDPTTKKIYENSIKIE